LARCSKREDTLNTSEIITIVVTLLAALIGAGATIYASVRASSRRRSNAPRLEAVLNLRKTAQSLIVHAAQEAGLIGGKDPRRLAPSLSWSFEHAAHEVLKLADFGRLRDALQSLYLALGWEDEADQVAQEGRRGRRAAVADRRAAIVEAGVEIERATRLMAKTYGRKLEKPAEPWGAKQGAP
jgi:hypothetical protein